MKTKNKRNLLYLTGFVALPFLMEACGVQPLAWQPDPKPAFEGTTTLNEELKNVEKVSLDGWYGPEDIVFDSVGNLYCGVHRSATDFSDGRILKISPEGKAEEFYNAASWVAGLHFDSHRNLIALSHREGLISISPDKQVTLLANQDASGKRFRILNGLDIASDGKMYFTNTSEEAAYTIPYGRKIILEMKPLGGFYCYDPKTGEVETLIAGTCFGNGVVLSEKEDYVLMVETAKYRVLRYWLKGEKKGQTDVFIDNLPGFPNGISIRDNGNYWLGFSTKRADALDKIHPKPGTKKLVYGLPEFMQPKAELFGMVMELSASGEIVHSFFDTDGTTMPEAGAVKEHNGSLYMGGDVIPYIGKYSLK